MNTHKNQLINEIKAIKERQEELMKLLANIKHTIFTAQIDLHTTYETLKLVLQERDRLENQQRIWGYDNHEDRNIEDVESITVKVGKE